MNRFFRQLRAFGRPKVLSLTLVLAAAMGYLPVRAQSSSGVVSAASANTSDRNLFNSLPSEVQQTIMQNFSPDELLQLSQMPRDQAAVKIITRLRERGVDIPKLLSMIPPEILDVFDPQGVYTSQINPSAAPKAAKQAAAVASETAAAAAAPRNKTPLALYLENSTDLPVPSRAVEPFGYSFFRSGAAMPPASDLVAVPDSYRVGPGDALMIYLWGRLTLRQLATVDRNGGVTLPVVGRLSLAGMTFDDATKAIERAYAGTEGVSVSVSLDRLRSIQVTVLGEAEKPGSYTVSSLDTLLNLLIQSGGPTPIGSLRKIEHRRGRRVIETFDFYDSMLKGEVRNDFRLQEGDVLFIPSSGARAAVIGYVQRPAIYELKGGETIQDLIGLAGGVLPSGDSSKVTLERIGKDQRREFRIITAAELKGAAIPVTPEDVITIDPVLPNPDRFVEVSGSVFRPGRLTLTPGLRVADAIRLAGGLNSKASEIEGELLIPVTVGGREVKYESRRFSPRQALDGDPDQNIELLPRSVVTIQPMAGIRTAASVELTGEFLHPGVYQILPGETLASVLKRAGGLSSVGDGNISFFTRESAKAVERARIDQLVRLLQGQLLSEGSYFVGDQASSTNRAFVQDMRQKLVDDLKSVEPMGRVVVDLPSILGGNADADLPLENGDKLFVGQKTKVVFVVGEVYNPGAMISRPGLNVPTLLHTTGGPTSIADDEAIYVVRANGLTIPPEDSYYDPWYGSPRGVDVAAGDTVVVPRYIPPSMVGWQIFKDAIGVVYQASLSAAAVNALRK